MSVGRMRRYLQGPLFAALIAGCTSETPDAARTDCSADDTCGGDITGTWFVTGFCLAGAHAFCTEATATYDTHTTAGTIQFLPDGTYSDSSMLSADVTIDIPESCMAATTCSGIGGQAMQAGMTGVASTDSGMACHITGTYPKLSIGSGTWTQASSITIDLVRSDGSPGYFNYCVNGPSLMRVDQFAFGSLRTIVATRQ